MFTRTLMSLTAATALTIGAAQADEVEVYLADMLDNKQAGYCLDIAGGREADADPADGLQGHTCYSPGGKLGVDQTFDTAKFADGQLYMTNFDVCAEAKDIAAGSKLGLETCDGSDKQSFVFTGSGTITAASAPELCVTVGTDTRSGRSSANQIKALTLETCTADAAARQTWDVRSSLN